jgi:hypothetical protein
MVHCFLLAVLAIAPWARGQTLKQVSTIRKPAPR